MENTKKYISNIFIKMEEIEPELKNHISVEEKIESIIEDLEHIYSDYEINDKLLSLEAREFREEIFNYNTTYIYDFSSKGSSLNLLSIVEDLLEAELISIKNTKEYLIFIDSFHKYIDRCYDLSILTNKIINLLEHDHNKEELSLSSRNPNLKEFFDSLTNSDKLNREFKLYIKSITKNKNKLLEEIV